MFFFGFYGTSNPVNINLQPIVSVSIKVPWWNSIFILS